jgi:hypothetical protein
MVEYWQVFVALLGVAASLFGVGLTLQSKGQKYRKDWQDEVNQLTAYHRHEMYTEFVLDGASELVSMGAISQELDRLRIEAASRITQKRDIRELEGRFKTAFETAKLSFTEDKRIRETLGATTKKVLGYSAERTLFQNAWKPEVVAGSAFERLAIAFGSGSAMAALGIVSGAEPWYAGLAFIVALLLSMIVGAIILEIKNQLALLVKARAQLERLLETEQHGVPGIEVEEVER